MSLFYPNTIEARDRSRGPPRGLLKMILNANTTLMYILMLVFVFYLFIFTQVNHMKHCSAFLPFHAHNNRLWRGVYIAHTELPHSVLRATVFIKNGRRPQAVPHLDVSGALEA